MRQTHSQHIHKGEKLKVFLLRSGIRQGCSNSPLPFSIVLEVLANTVRQDQKKKKKKGVQIKKEEIKLLLFADDMILYTENPKESIKKLLE